MARYRNTYKCPVCEITWTEVMSNTQNSFDQCPVCRKGCVEPVEIFQLPDDANLTRRGAQIEAALACTCGASAGEKPCDCA